VKLVFWFLLFGPTGFVFFFIPSFISYFLGFGHLNYISHLPDQDGHIRIKDHRDGWYYKVMNVITSGGYFHKSHHEKPWLYNPSRQQL
jgi:stearoyl-CoA desaturase (delta-9 desaturase)